MKYPKEYLEEIKTRLKVSTVISKSVILKKRGKEFVGLSPFKNEKTPSFTVNDEKGFYHCFSTGEHGNIFDFLMKTQNLKFGETVKTLANLAGMRPYLFSKQDEQREKKFREYIAAFNDYIDICHNNIINNKNKIVLDYLKKRNLSFNIIKKFNLGFNQDKRDIYYKLKNKYSENTLKDTGLFYYDEKINKFVEKFRNRLIFPIYNVTNNPIGVGGRIIENKNYLAKYINSPETPFFKKGSNLYNLNNVRSLSNNHDTVFLVEGYMDVIGLAKNNIFNSVASLGTALTERQINILYQFFDHIVICFDSDVSGINAAKRASENSIKDLQPNKKISFLFLPEKEDPDTFVNKNGKEYFLKYSNDNLVSIFDFIFNSYKEKVDNNPSSMALFEKNLRNSANSIKDNFIKKYALEYYLEKISILTPNIKSTKTFFKKSPKSLNITQKYYEKTKKISYIEIKEFSILCLILKNLKFFSENLNLIDELNLITSENILILEKIRNDLKNNIDLNIKDLNIDSQLIDKIFNFSSIKFILEKNELNEQYITEIFNDIKRDIKNFELESRIEELEVKFSKDFNENTFNELKELKKLQKVN